MITQELMISMRDGISLQSTIFLPESEGPFPGLMVRCMYGIDQRIRQRAESFVAAGYAVVAQNVRGRHQSEGGQISYADFPEDGFDTLAWMVAQPWCNGRIGAFGESALARVQIATALTGHPAFRAMCPIALPYGPSSHFGGSFLLHQTPLWFFLALSGPELNPVDQIDWMFHLNKLPATAILDDVGGPLALFREAVTHPHQDGRMGFAQPQQFAQLNTPNLLVTGWYDHCGTGTVDFYLHTMAYGTPEQQRNTHLVIGPWDHWCDPDVIPDYNFGTAAKRDHVAEELLFFERHLKQERVAPAPPKPSPDPLPGKNGKNGRSGSVPSWLKVGHAAWPTSPNRATSSSRPTPSVARPGCSRLCMVCARGRYELR